MCINLFVSLVLKDKWIKLELKEIVITTTKRKMKR